MQCGIHLQSGTYTPKRRVAEIKKKFLDFRRSHLEIEANVLFVSFSTMICGMATGAKIAGIR